MTFNQKVRAKQMQYEARFTWFLKNIGAEVNERNLALTAELVSEEIDE
jgi:hypothetical protein